ncbi:DUF5302 domain-containing protein [Actinomadura sp. HBU206391]|uniref:DUF5302 domain-containing protein n=1 Tax=Actinomadura sp. HBU206391 TaxID=2731692 RepID=UPI00164F52C1|nr:DUF5302 domain-containing protein [Actinomadura sp. HBU206391]MBC6460797.1 DUF5302 domain-containing protein [Actinomadura sp. HBU206391]
MSSGESEPTNPDDDAKRKFREALERKRGRQASERTEGQGKGSTGVSHTHGPVKNRRQFRRKSGG